VVVVIAIILFFIIVLNKSSEVILVDGAEIPTLTCAQIPEVSVIYREGCPACAVAIPRIQELEQELNIEVGYYDLAVVEDAQKIKELELIVQFVPSIIINCKVHIGAKSKEEFRQYILEE
jgi:thiol-disulfide isomerase/thioredoxin